MGHPAADGGGVAEDGARGREDEGVGYEAEGNEEADGGWLTVQVSFSRLLMCSHGQRKWHTLSPPVLKQADLLG